MIGGGRFGSGGGGLGNGLQLWFCHSNTYVAIILKCEGRRGGRNPYGVRMRVSSLNWVCFSQIV